jgi:hypothetical protein
MISPVSLHYMAVAMGHNTRGINTPTLRHRHPLHMLDIVPSKCVQMRKRLPYWNSIIIHIVMTLMLSARSLIRGSSICSTGSTRVVVCSIPQNDSAAITQQSDSASSCARLSISSNIGFLFHLTLSAFLSHSIIHSFPFFTCNTKIMGLINRIKYDVLT